MTIKNPTDRPYVGALILYWINQTTGKVDHLPGSYIDTGLQPGATKTLVHTSNSIVSRSGQYRMQLTDGHGGYFANCSSSPIRVYGEQEYPDLIIEAIEAPMWVGIAEKIPVTITIRNIGNSPSPPANGQLFWDKVPTFSETAQPLRNPDLWPALAVGQSHTQTITASPGLEVPSGPAHFFYKIDENRNVQEANERNNQSTFSRICGYRLEATSDLKLSPPPPWVSGSTFSASMYITNYSDVTFNGTLALNLFDENHRRIQNLVTWPLSLAAQVTYQLPSPTSAPLIAPGGNTYQLFAEYRTTHSSTWTKTATGFLSTKAPMQVFIRNPDTPNTQAIFRLPYRAPH